MEAENADGLKRESERVMKKIVLSTLIAVLMLVCILTLASCNIVIQPPSETESPETQTSETKEPETEAHVHAYGAWTQIPPTCTEKGSMSRTCDACGDVEENAINALGHNYSTEWTTDIDPTCTSVGSKSHHCTRCSDKVDVTEIAKKEHTPKFANVENKVAATCTTDGSYNSVIYCSACGGEASREAMVIPALGHNYSTEWTVDIEPTCTSAGSKSHTCSRCFEKADITEIPPKTHSYVSTIIQPTKTADGYTKHTCSACGDNYTDEPVPAIGSLGLIYKASSDGKTCTITAIGTCTDTEIYIPSMIDGYCVTGIANRAFDNCSNLTSITIPNSITSIGNLAFRNCSGLESITVHEGNPNYHSTGNCVIETANKILVVGCKNSVIPTDGSVVIIGDYAFIGCSGLISITIPTSVLSIGVSAFSGCGNLTDVTIPNSVTSIGASAFYKCSGLTIIIVPDSVTSIGLQAFGGCSNLTSLTIPFVGAMKDGTTNTHFGYIFGTEYNSSNDEVVPASLKTVVITGGKSIGERAFYECSTIESITIPNSVTSIGEWAFYLCRGLKSITIPDSVTSIGEYAFFRCGIKSIVLSNNITSIAPYTFSESGLTSITIPNGVTSIGHEAFNDCSFLTSVTIPSSITKIGYSAFSDCTRLANIKFEGTVDQWTEITKEYAWNSDCAATQVNCNGEIVALK